MFHANPTVERRLHAHGVPYDVLNVRGRWDAQRILLRYLRGAAGRSDEIVHSYLAVPNVLTVPVKLVNPRARLVWGIRMSDSRLFTYNALTTPVHALEARLSRFADLVIANSHAGKDDAVAHGFDPSRMCVVDNGIDTETFRPDPEGRRRLRAEWGVADRDVLIGLVARLEPKKDHPTFLRAAAAAAARRPDLRFVCIGEGSPSIRGNLERQSRALGLENRLRWQPSVMEPAAAYSAFDLATLSSAFGEGFPNVLGEALACGRPCVATDVGDAARILDGVGVTVSPRSPTALAEAWLNALEADHVGLAEPRRSRIVQNYGLERMVERTEALLQGIVG